MSEENGRKYQFDDTEAAIQVLEIYRQSVIRQEELLKEAKGSLEHLARKFLEIASRNQPDVADELATQLYWFYDKWVPASVICDYYGTYPQSIQQYVGKAVLTITCIDCSQPFEEVLRSRTHLNDLRRSGKGICPECQSKRDERNKALTNDYVARKQAEADAIHELRNMPYAAYLKTPHWQTVRAKMLKHAGYRCQVCNSKNVSLHVHHRTYENRGEERWGDLIVLCADCHETFHTNGSLSHE